MNKITIFWFKNKLDILVGLFCLLLIFWGVKNLYVDLSLPGKPGIVWAGWMAVVIAASIGLGAAINKIAVREQKIDSNSKVSDKRLNK